MLGGDNCRGENKAGKGAEEYGLIFYTGQLGEASLIRCHLSKNLKEVREVRDMWLPREAHSR